MKSSVERKTCSRCKKRKPINGFGCQWNNKKQKMYRRPHCKSCDVIISSEYRKTKAGKISRTGEHRRRFQRHYSFFKNVKSKISCCSCNEGDSCCIDFHHVDGAEKRFAITNSIRCSIKRICDEMLKCIALCSNCHRKFHAGRLPMGEEMIEGARNKIKIAIAKAEAAL